MPIWVLVLACAVSAALGAAAAWLIKHAQHSRISSESEFRAARILELERERDRARQETSKAEQGIISLREQIGASTCAYQIFNPPQIGR